MWIADGWKDYELLDCGGGEKLERWGDQILVRPDPQAIWESDRKNRGWRTANARYSRSSTGGGDWDKNKLPERGATVACAAAGASVCHVDAAKGMVAWAKENARVSGLQDAPIRWIVDDCAKFVEREIRRGKTYDAIIMDPPSYGRGPGGEVWKLEENLYPFVKLCARVLSDKPLFVILNSYTTGLAPSVLGYILQMLVGRRFGGRVTWDELGLPCTDSGMALPCGATGRWMSK